MKSYKIFVYFTALLGLTVSIPTYSQAYDLQDTYNLSYIGDPCSAGFYAGADFLLWYAQQDGISFANSAMIDVGIGINSTNAEDVFLKNNKWQPGGRAYLGFRPAGATWDIRASYTYFEAHQNSGLVEGSLVIENGANGNLLIDAFIPNYIDITGDSTSSNQTDWRLHFNQVDLEFSKEFFVSQDARLRPFFGLRGIEMKQKLQGLVTGIYNMGTNQGIFSLPSFSSLDAQCTLEGIGAMFGLEANYTVGKGFDFYGSLSGGLLWGRFKVEEFTHIVASPEIDVDESLLREPHSSLFCFDVAFGIKWNYVLGCNGQLLSLKLGWEQHLITKTNQFQDLILSSFSAMPQAPLIVDHNIQRGDLSLQGFVFGASFAF